MTMIHQSIDRHPRAFHAHATARLSAPRPASRTLHANAFVAASCCSKLAEATARSESGTSDASAAPRSWAAPPAAVAGVAPQCSVVLGGASASARTTSRPTAARLTVPSPNSRCMIVGGGGGAADTSPSLSPTGRTMTYGTPLLRTAASARSFHAKPIPPIQFSAQTIVLSGRLTDVAK